MSDSSAVFPSAPAPKLVQSSYSRKSASSYRQNKTDAAAPQTASGTSPVSLSPFGLPPSAPIANNGATRGNSKSPSPAGRSPVSAPSISPELSPEGTSPVESNGSKPFSPYQPISIPSSTQGTPVNGPQPSPFRVTAPSTNKRYVHHSTDNMLTPVDDGGNGGGDSYKASPQLTPTTVLVRQSPPLAPKKAPAAPPPLPDMRDDDGNDSPYSPPYQPQNRFAALEKKKHSVTSRPQVNVIIKPTNTEAMPTGLPDFQITGATPTSTTSTITSNPDAVVAEAEAEAITKRRAKREAFEAKKAKRKAYYDKPPIEHEEFNSDYSSSTNSKSIEVPLTQPRYERSYRQSKSMSVSDSQSDTCHSASELRDKSSHETLKIINGRNVYTGEMTFDTYAMYKHGKGKIITDSVGYANDGDLLVQREDIQSESEPESFALQRTNTAITSAVCIDSRARRPMMEDEEARLSRRKQLNLKKNKKYPGIRAPRNKKIINRLQNDSLVTHPLFRELLLNQGVLAKRQDGNGDALEFIASEDSLSTEEVEALAAANPGYKRMPRRKVRKAKGSFEQKRIPKEFIDLLDKDEEVQNAYLERKGISVVMSAAMPNLTLNSRHQPPPDPNGAESRFHALNARLKQEIKHALGGSEFLTDLAVELEEKFATLIVEAQEKIVTAADPAAVKRRKHIVKPLEFAFRDGYGRLVCHAVAAYYRLVSTSDTNESGKRITLVTLPTSVRARAGALELPNSTLVRHLLKGYKKTKNDVNSKDISSAVVTADNDNIVSTEAVADTDAVLPDAEEEATGMALPTLSLEDYQAEEPQLNH